MIGLASYLPLNCEDFSPSPPPSFPEPSSGKQCPDFVYNSRKPFSCISALKQDTVKEFSYSLQKNEGVFSAWALATSSKFNE